MAGEFRYDLADVVVEKIVTDFSPGKIVIFGSVAGREAEWDGDVDIPLVMKTDDDRMARTLKVMKSVGGIQVPKDTVAITPEEFQDGEGRRVRIHERDRETGCVAYEV